MRFFNTAGPIISGDHYHISPLGRIDLDEVLLLIEQKHGESPRVGNVKVRRIDLGNPEKSAYLA